MYVAVCVVVAEASAADPEATTEGCVLTNVEAQVDESSSDSSDISLGNVSIRWYCKFSVMSYSNTSILV